MLPDGNKKVEMLIMAEKSKESRFKSTWKSLSRFFKDIRNELKKVVWLNRKQLVNNTITVLLACLIIGAVIWVADLVFAKATELIFVR